jgi:rod shape-determining protein MreD
MGILLGLPLMAGLAILQSSVVAHLQLLNGRPDLVLLAVIGWSLAGRPVEAMVWGLIGGAFLDTLSGQPMGATSMALVLIAYLASWLEGRFWEAHLFMTLGVTLIASLLFYLMMLAVLLITGQPVDWGLAFTRVVLPSSFINLLLAVPVAQLSSSAQRALFPEKVAI